ncbi:MAG: universal stress protein [Polyangiaceae bacterium]|nr:universal stress protein [Polyangiaceae bacterium]
MTILCASDFSLSAEPALAAAAAIAQRVKGQDLLLVHALDLLDPALARLDLDVSRDEAEVRLGEAVARARKISGGIVGSAIVYGSAASAVTELAELRHAELVVVGSQGHGAQPFRRLGGTSERIAQLLEEPLLVVRDAAPFEAWVIEGRPLKVLLGIDRTTSWDAALSWINRLRGAGPCDVIVAQVYYPADERRHYGLPPGHAIDRVDAEVESLLVRDMRERALLSGSGHVQFQPVLGIGRLGDHLVDFAKRQDVDIIALGTHHRHGFARFASVANVTLHYARASVLLVPPERVVSTVKAPRRILIAADLSPRSGRTIAHGLSLVEGRPDADVVIMHVDEQMHADPEEALRKFVPAASVERVRIIVARGADVARLVCTEAERIGADVVCVGSHGRSAVARTLLGSIADQIVRECERPVLVVRSKES